MKSIRIFGVSIVSTVAKGFMSELDKILLDAKRIDVYQ